MVTNIMAVTYIWNSFSIKHLYVSMSVMPRNMHTYITPREMSLALYGPNVSDDKNSYFGGRGNLESIMLLWLPIFRW